MNQPEPSPEFLDLVDDALVPSPEPSAVIRVAEFHFGDGRLAPAIEATGMVLVTSLDATRETPDFYMMADFDLVLADVPSDSGKWAEANQFLLRFLRVRRPAAFVVVGCAEEMFRLSLAGASRPFGYEVSINRQEGPEFVAGVHEREPEGEVWAALNGLMREIWEKLVGTTGR